MIKDWHKLGKEIRIIRSLSRKKNRFENFDTKKIQPQIMKTKIFTRFNIIKNKLSWLCNKVETRKDFRFNHFWLYFGYQNFANGYFQTSLGTIPFDVICGI